MTDDAGFNLPDGSVVDEAGFVAAVRAGKFGPKPDEAWGMGKRLGRRVRLRCKCDQLIAFIDGYAQGWLFVPATTENASGLGSIAGPTEWYPMCADHGKPEITDADVDAAVAKARGAGNTINWRVSCQRGDHLVVT
ncbi:MAG TPA: hypothetical protein VGL75_10645 [Acidothermaceae bacterium]|jgi:hypothetical protein